MEGGLVMRTLRKLAGILLIVTGLSFVGWALWLTPNVTKEVPGPLTPQWSGRVETRAQGRQQKKVLAPLLVGGAAVAFLGLMVLPQPKDGNP